MENNTTPKKKKPIIPILLVVVAIAGFFGVRAILHNMKYETTDNAQIESRSVPVVSRVAGYIEKLDVDDYGKVTQNESIIKIDDEEYALAEVQAKAEVLNAKADEANATAAYSNAIANKQLAEANANVQLSRLTKSEADLKRDEALFKEGAVTQKQLDDTRAAYDANNKQYISNKNQINLANTQVAISQAQIQKIKALIETREAALKVAALKVGYCNISAPVSGRIGKRNVVEGQYVQAGSPLFSIINDQAFWIVANFKETQLEKMSEGQEVNIKLDGYPDLDIKGKISSFSQATGAKFALLPADNATGNFVKITQRVPVKIDIVNPEQYTKVLRAGLSVEVEVNVQ